MILNVRLLLNELGDQFLGPERLVKSARLRACQDFLLDLLLLFRVQSIFSARALDLKRLRSVAFVGGMPLADGFAADAQSSSDFGKRKTRLTFEHLDGGLPSSGLELLNGLVVFPYMYHN